MMNKKIPKIKVGESYYFKNPGINGFGNHTVVYETVIITDIYEGINGKIVSFKEKCWLFPEQFVCSYAQFLEGIVRRESNNEKR